MRILVCGSRDWKGEQHNIWAILEAKLREARKKGETFVLVHGDCPKGADRVARNWARSHKPGAVTEEPHAAQWRVNGRVAGFMRNDLMANMGADLCLAFQVRSSTGTQHMINAARKAGIPTIVYHEGTSLRGQVETDTNRKRAGR